MELLGWIGGGLLGFLFLVFALFKWVLIPRNLRREAEKAAQIESDGDLVYCYIVVANNELYKEKATDDDDYSYAQVIYTESDDPSQESMFSEIAERLKKFKPPAVPSENERIIGSVMATHVPYFDPLLLPMDLTDGKWSTRSPCESSGACCPNADSRAIISGAKSSTEAWATTSA